MLTYDGVYLYANTVAVGILRSEYRHHGKVAGRCIWDVAPAARQSVFGRAVAASLADRSNRRMVFPSPDFGGPRVAVAITTYPDCIHVRFRFDLRRRRLPLPE